MSASSLPGWLRNYPAIVVRIDTEGRILESNGRVEELYAEGVEGRPLADFLDQASSGEKWRRLLEQLSGGSDEPGRTWEFVLRGADTLQEPRGFSALRDEERDCIWLVEHHRDPRLDGLRTQVVETNTELSNTQRELLKERSELSATLAELEAQQRITETLMATVREQNLELQRSNRALDEFAHAISHDLKSPLRSIGHYAGFLRDDLIDSMDEESIQHMDRLQDRVARLRAMIDGVLEFSRVGRTREEAETVDVGKMIDQIVDLLDGTDGVRVEYAELPNLQTEYAPLQQVLLNLISNGVRYAEGPSPTVRIEARRQGDFWEFQVSDTGPGIPRTMRERIWHLFQTLEPSSATQGTGIGLAIVKRQVERMGGEVWVESAEGSGSTFHFTWPDEPGTDRRATTGKDETA